MNAYPIYLFLFSNREHRIVEMGKNFIKKSAAIVTFFR